MARGGFGISTPLFDVNLKPVGSTQAAGNTAQVRVRIFIEEASDDRRLQVAIVGGAVVVDNDEASDRCGAPQPGVLSAA